MRDYSGKKARNPMDSKKRYRGRAPSAEDLAEERAGKKQARRNGKQKINESKLN